MSGLDEVKKDDEVLSATAFYPDGNSQASPEKRGQEVDISPNKQRLKPFSPVKSQQSVESVYTTNTMTSSKHSVGKEQKKHLEVSSRLERVLKEKVAKELFTRQGKGSVIFIWTVGTFIALYGCTQVEVDFK